MILLTRVFTASQLGFWRWGRVLIIWRQRLISHVRTWISELQIWGPPTVRPEIWSLSSLPAKKLVCYSSMKSGRRRVFWGRDKGLYYSWYILRLKSYLLFIWNEIFTGHSVLLSVKSDNSRHNTLHAHQHICVRGWHTWQGTQEHEKPTGIVKILGRWLRDYRLLWALAAEVCCSCHRGAWAPGDWASSMVTPVAPSMPQVAEHLLCACSFQPSVLIFR